MPTKPCFELKYHSAAINGMCWGDSKHLCTVGDDYKALIWDISAPPSATSSSANNVIDDPILIFNSDNHIDYVDWSPHKKFISISNVDKLQVLKV